MGNEKKPSSLSATTTTKKRKRDEKAVEVLEVDISAPEPPSKKALRKVKKQRSTTAPSTDHDTATSTAIQPDSEDITRTGEDITRTGEKPAKRAEHGIWIGNLPFRVTKADLRSFLTTNSSITDDEITRIHLPTLRRSNSASTDPKTQGEKSAPQNKGFAYIDLLTAEALQHALELSETLLTGRRVLIKDAKSFEGRPDKPKTETTKAGVTLTGKRIFVGNLGFDVTTDDLKEHFAQCGEVKDVHTATFEDSGKCKGYGWVEFASSEAAKVAVRGWIRPAEEDGSGSEEVEDGEDVKVGGMEVGEKLLQGHGKKRKTTDRKWVNRIKGRQLRMELAEDKSVRYQKRFGKHRNTKKKVSEPAPTASDGVGAVTVGTKIQFNS